MHTIIFTHTFVLLLLYYIFQNRHTRQNSISLGLNIKNKYEQYAIYVLSYKHYIDLIN